MRFWLYRAALHERFNVHSQTRLKAGCVFSSPHSSLCIYKNLQIRAAAYTHVHACSVILKTLIRHVLRPQMHMFIARYCDLLNVVISCDGCERMAPWHRYRCLQCMDMDLCKTCFLSKCMTPMIRGPSRSRSYTHSGCVYM